MQITDITAGLSSIKTIGDIATFLLKAKLGSDVAQKAIELQSTIIALQTAMLTAQAQIQGLTTENDQLKKQLADVENWNAEAAKYRLKEVTSGNFAYVLNEDQTRTQPNHWLCVYCFHRQQKSILQKNNTIPSHWWKYDCPTCKNSISSPVD